MIKLEDIKVGAIVNHVIHNKQTYVITDTNSRAKINGVWHNVICYSPNYANAYTRFSRDINDFMNSFELVK